MSVRLSIIAAVATVSLLLGACASSDASEGHGDGHSGAEQLADPVAGAPDILVRAGDINFSPDMLRLTAGEPANLTVENNGEVLHDFTLDEAQVHVNVAPGERKTTSLTISEPGRYEARCTVPGHAEAGMTIDVLVS